MRSYPRSVALAHVCLAVAAGLRAKLEVEPGQSATTDFEYGVECAWVDCVLKTDVPVLDADGNVHTALYGEIHMQTVNPMKIENVALVPTDVPASYESLSAPFGHAYRVRMPVPVGVVRVIVVDASGVRVSAAVEFLVNPASRQVRRSGALARSGRLLPGGVVRRVSPPNRLAGSTSQSDGIHADRGAAAADLGGSIQRHGRTGLEENRAQ